MPNRFIEFISFFVHGDLLFLLLYLLVEFNLEKSKYFLPINYCIVTLGNITMIYEDIRAKELILRYFVDSKHCLKSGKSNLLDQLTHCNYLLRVRILQKNTYLWHLKNLFGWCKLFIFRVKNPWFCSIYIYLFIR